MELHSETFTVRSSAHNEVIDVTAEVEGVIAGTGVREGICTVYVPHATAAITVNENADPNIGTDFLAALRKIIIEHDGWLHDRIDNNAAAHIKAALVGPSVTIPIQGGRLALGTWQNVILCDFDGPRRGRRVQVSVIG